MTPVLDPLLRGIAVGAFGVTALSVWRSDLRRDARIATVLVCVSAAAWIVTEGSTTWAALGRFPPLLVLAFPTAGLFWAFVATVFEDRPLTARTFAPAALFAAAGLAMTLTQAPASTRIAIGFNLAAAALCLHAGLVILRGWRGDLVETRRSLRAAILGFSALFAAVQGGAGMMNWLAPSRAWAALGVGELGGAAVVAVIALAIGGLFLHGRVALFDSQPAAKATQEARLLAADRVLLAHLQAAMADGAWRNEGLTIRSLAEQLKTPEHRLRRLINLRLGHRNFADFVNGYRIEAALARLADPAEAATTVAAIAYDVGYGSLSPFNRAFRKMTGSTPTDWREAALQGWLERADAD